MAGKKQNDSSIVQNKGVESKKNTFDGKIQYLTLDQLADFKNHPFKVERAAGITVYGYSAPVTDVEAVELMKSAISISQMKDIAPFTIINLPENEDEQRRKWSEFYDVKMVLYCNEFKQSLLWRNPRVSLETVFDAILQGQPRSTEKPFKEFSKLRELQDYVKTTTEFDRSDFTESQISG